VKPIPPQDIDRIQWAVIREQNEAVERRQRLAGAIQEMEQLNKKKKKNFWQRQKAKLLKTEIEQRPKDEESDIKGWTFFKKKKNKQ